MNLQEIIIELSTGDKLKLYHNLPLEGRDNLQDALKVWMSQTDVLTAESFCSYINSKREQGHGRFYAFTSQEHYDTWVESLGDEELEAVAKMYDAADDEDNDEEFDGMTAETFQDDWKINFKVHQKELTHKDRKYLIDIKPFEATTQAERKGYGLTDNDYLIHLFDGAGYKNFRITSGIDEDCNIVWQVPPGVDIDDDLVAIIGTAVKEIYQ